MSFNLLSGLVDVLFLLRKKQSFYALGLHDWVVPFGIARKSDLGQFTERHNLYDDSFCRLDINDGGCDCNGTRIERPLIFKDISASGNLNF